MINVRQRDNFKEDLKKTLLKNKTSIGISSVNYYHRKCDNAQ